MQDKARKNAHHRLLGAVCALFILCACGGGGGGGGGGGDTIVLEYAGNTEPTIITPANATGLTANLLGVGELSGQLPTTAAVTTPPVPAVGLLPLLRIFHSLPRPTPKAHPNLSAIQTAVVKIDEKQACYPDGSYQLKGSIDDQDGTGTITLTYDDCQDYDTFLNGTVTWRVDAAILTEDAWLPIDSTFTFKTIAMIAPGMNILLGGALREQLNPNGSQTLTFNIVIKDTHTQQMQKTENVVMDLIHGDGYYLSETIRGRFYDSLAGYLDVTTPHALRYEDEASLFPSGGQLHIAGAGGSHLLLTALSQSVTLIKLDLDGNTVYEISGSIPWDVLTKAGTDPEDVDGDGLPDSWESTYGLSNATYADAGSDNDADTLSNYEEYRMGTDPTESDTDGDEMPDGWEVAYGFNPVSDMDAVLDSDLDGAANFQEHTFGTDPTDSTSTPADLAVHKRVSISTVSAGTLFEYTLEVTNLGPGMARGVYLTDVLPEGTKIFTAVPGVLPTAWNCTINSGSVSCEPNAGTLAPDESASILLPVIAPAATGSISNHVTIDSATLDYAEENDTAAIQTTVANAVLAQVDIALDNEGGVDGLERPQRLVLSPDGKHVYVAGLIDDAVAVFSRDPGTGALTFVEAQRDGIDTPGKPDWPKAVAVSPDGDHVFVTTEWSDGEWVGSLVVYSRNPDTGTLGYLAKYRDGADGVDGLAIGSAVILSSDGNNVYVAGAGDNAVAVFDRDGSTGQLTFNMAVVDGVDGVDGLAGILDVALSPDDGFLYASGSLDHAIAVFIRESDGGLSYSGSTTGLFNPVSISPSSDGKHLYVVAGPLLAFARNADTGALTLLAAYANGENGLVGLDGMHAVTVAPDGKNVYVPATYDNSLGVFARDLDAGTLRFIEVQKRGIGAVEGLGVAWSAAVSPDSAYVYVSAQDDTLSAFSVNAK